MDTVDTVETVETKAQISLLISQYSLLITNYSLFFIPVAIFPYQRYYIFLKLVYILPKAP